MDTYYGRDAMVKSANKLVGIDLFAGAGGMSLGAQWAGINIQTAVEIDPHAAATYARNHPKTHLHQQDICKLRKISFDSRTKQTVVFGGPPCKGFSTSNQRTRNRDNPSNHLYKEFLRVVKQANPDWIVFENVKGILETEDRLFLNIILNSLTSYDYTLNWGVLNAADFGVPQNRSRLFIIGSRHGVRVDLPRPTTKRKITVAEAIADLPRLPNGASLCLMPYRPSMLSQYSKRCVGD